MAHTADPPPTASAADEAPVAPRRGFWAAGWAKFSDNAIPSLVVAVMAGLVLFFFNETGDRITRLDADIGDQINETNDRITRFDESVGDQINETNDRITRLDTEHDARFIRLEENQRQLAVTLAALTAEFSAFREEVDARFEAIEARLTRLEENQQEIAVTLARLVALVEAHFEVPAIASG
ncbi:MAG: hypothetical protein F4Y12_07615 [Acidimicrobiaceae bacterium]|nr:hypothetical protein [Acidimicrobiaceae bacterium]